jgi:transposase
LQSPAPDLLIEKGRPGPGLVANVVVGKYLDGLPLYRQSAIMAREGMEIERASLADWVGHVAWWVMPPADLIGANVTAAPVIHTDDTPIAVLAPGNGKTRTGACGLTWLMSGLGKAPGPRLRIIASEPDPKA